MRRYLDLPYGTDEKQKLDIYLPDGEEFDVFLYFHGGGLENGKKDFSEESVRFLTENGIALVSADYRLYPDAKYPDFVEDAASAADYTLRELPNYGKCRSFSLGGSSAGGYLSMMLCFAPRFLARVGRKPEDFDGYLHDAGQPTCHFNVLRERGIDSRRVIVDDTCPLYYVGTAESYPFMQFIVSDHDMKNRYEQTRLMLSTMRHFGYDMSKVAYLEKQGTHVAYVKEKTPEGHTVFCEIIRDFVSKIGR